MITAAQTVTDAIDQAVTEAVIDTVDQYIPTRKRFVRARYFGWGGRIEGGIGTTEAEAIADLRATLAWNAEHNNGAII